MEPRKQAGPDTGLRDRKVAIMAALDKFVAQRPGLEFGNYGDVKAYRSEMRSITRDRHDYNALARAVERSDSITTDMLIKAAESAFSGRLSFWERPECNAGRWFRVDYVTGQYFPTEYRKAACAVLASALWAWARERCLPASCNTSVDGHQLYPDHTGRTVLSAGDWLRAYFRREFGRSIANRWFS